MCPARYPTHITDENILQGLPEHWDAELNQAVCFWLRDLRSGIRPLTMRTIQTFRERFIRYTLKLKNEYGFDPLNIRQALDLKTVYAVISSYPVKSYSNRHNTFYAIHSFARFLIQVGDLEEEYLPKLKKFRPRRVIPPQRVTLKDKESLLAIRIALKPENFRREWTYQFTRAVFETFLQTGLRNTELCNLQLDDVHLEDGVIRVNLGKGRKNRIVGIPNGLLPILKEYLPHRLGRVTQETAFFLNSYDLPFHQVSMGRIIKKVGNLAGVKITPHALRRAFATFNAEQGRPLHLIQLALGHSDIRTTQEYLMTDQQQVIQAMKEW